MKSYRFKLFLTLLLCLTVLGSSAAAEAVHPSVAKAYDRQLFILPNVTRDYPGNDASKHFQQFLNDALQLFQTSGKVRTGLFSNQETAPTLIEGAMETAAVELPVQVEDTTASLKKIPACLHDSESNLVVAIESANAQRQDTISERWFYLKKLASAGVPVLLIGLETRNNQGAATALSTWCNKGQPDPAFEANRIMDYGHNLHFVWINDYNNLSTTLLPLMNTLVGKEFVQAESDEEGNYHLFPYAALTQSTTLMLLGDLTGADFQILNGQSEPVDYVTEFQDDMMMLVNVSGGQDTLIVPSTTGLTGLAWWNHETAVSTFSLTLENADGKTLFTRNEEARFFVSISDMDAERLVNDMALHNDRCELIDAKTGETLTYMTYDAKDHVFRANYVFQSSCEKRYLQARIQLSTGIELLSKYFALTVTNTAPIVKSLGETLYWIHDPWDESGSSLLRIPIETSDAENDEIQLRIDNPRSGVMAGLGSIKISDDQQYVEIELNDEPQTETPFTILIAGSDGEQDSSQCQIAFQLFDLQAQLQALQQQAKMILPEEENIFKRQNFTVAVKIELPETVAPLLRQSLSKVLQEHLTFQLSVVSMEDGSTKPPLNMDYVDGQWQCTVQLDASGDYALTAICNTQTPDALAFEVNSVTDMLQVQNHPPKAMTDSETLTLEEALMEDDGTGTESFALSGLKPSKLFADEDGDEISMTLTAQRMQEKSEDSEITLTAEASGEKEASLVIRVPGTYQVTAASRDEDEPGEIITFTVKAVSVRAQQLKRLLLLAALIVAAILLILLVIHLIKPSFKGKVVHLTLHTSQWDSKSTLHLDAWKKKKQPMYLLLTCAACPPDDLLYAAFEGCEWKPMRHGAVLLKTESLGMGKKILFRDNEPVTLQVGQYSLELMVAPNESPAPEGVSKAI